MEIKKVIKRSGKELILEWYYKDGEFNPEIKKNDRVYFICEECNNEESRIRKYFKSELCNICQRKITNLKKYGVSNISKLDEIKEKQKNTNLKRYGFTTPLMNEDVLAKTKETNINRYEIHIPKKSIKVKEKIREKDYYNLKVWNNDFSIPLFSKEEFKGVHYSLKYKFQCKTCGKIFLDDIYAGKTPKCPTCFPSGISIGEKEIVNFLKQYVEIIENDRELIKPKEIDILIPSLKLAIEYNGEYWHQDNEREEVKRKLIEGQEYEYLIIWENEWKNNREEVKEMLLEKIS